MEGLKYSMYSRMVAGSQLTLILAMVMFQCLRGGRTCMIPWPKKRSLFGAILVIDSIISLEVQPLLFTVWFTSFTIFYSIRVYHDPKGVSLFIKNGGHDFQVFWCNFKLKIWQSSWHRKLTPQNLTWSKKKSKKKPFQLDFFDGKKNMHSKSRAFWWWFLLYFSSAQNENPGQPTVGIFPGRPHWGSPWGSALGFGPDPGGSSFQEPKFCVFFSGRNWIPTVETQSCLKLQKSATFGACMSYVF